MKKHICIIVFYGAIWGLVEATLGHALHILPVKIGWMLWFPIAFSFMKTVYLKTGKHWSVIITALITANIKLVDLFTSVRIDYVINPAVSIVLESIAVYTIFRVVSSYGINKSSIILINTGWRILYMLYVLFLPEYLIKISPISSCQSFLNFFFIENIVTSIFIYAIEKIREKSKNLKNKENINYNEFSPVLSVTMLIISVYIQWVI